ncbi:MAG: hypothetical protein IJD58_00445 [Lachnospiraceae bacterium]|nr:hypothetical protein [Lachnospiraceae bacterium]
MRHLKGAMDEAVSSVLPIAALVLFLSVTLAPMITTFMLPFATGGTLIRVRMAKGVVCSVPVDKAFKL